MTEEEPLIVIKMAGEDDLGLGPAHIRTLLEAIEDYSHYKSLNVKYQGFPSWKMKKPAEWIEKLRKLLKEHEEIESS